MDKTGNGYEVKAKLSRDLKLFDITMIGVGAMIGAGIFVLTGIAAGVAGPALIIAFALNGIMTLITAMSYAELGSAIPEAGGGYLWIKQGLPGSNAFMAGWMSWFGHAVAGSLYALGFGAYFYLILDSLEINFLNIPEFYLKKILAVIVAVIFLYINYRGVSETGKAENIVTVAKIVILAIYIISGFVAIIKNPEYFNKFIPFAPKKIKGIITAMGLTFIAFEGYEIIVQAGEEVKNPRKNIPKAVFFSLLIVIPIYILVAFVTLGAVNPDTNQPTYLWLGKQAELGVARAAEQFMPLGLFLLLVGGLLSTISALNATIFSSTRVSFAMGRDKNLPDVFSHINPKTHTPHLALLFSGVLIIFMAVAIPIEHVAAAADIMFLLLFLQVNVAIISIRKKYKDKLAYGFLIPFFPILPIIGIISQLALAVFLFTYSPLAWYVTFGWLLVGFIIYKFYASKREMEKITTPIAVTQKIIFEKKFDVNVMVAVANKQTLNQLVEFACNVTKFLNGKLYVLNVIKLPRQIPYSEGFSKIEQASSLVKAGLDIAKKYDIPAEALVRIAHSAYHSIINTVNEKNIDYVIMGWRGKSKDPKTTIGKNIDKVINHVNSNIIVIETRKVKQKSNKIFVPIAFPKQGEISLNIASIIASQTPNTQIDVYHFVTPNVKSDKSHKVQEDIKNLLDKVKTKFKDFPVKYNLVIKNSKNPFQSIVQISKNYDYVIVGAGKESWFKRVIFDTKAQKLAQQCKPPLILIRMKSPPWKFKTQKLIDFFGKEESELEV